MSTYKQISYCRFQLLQQQKFSIVIIIEVMKLNQHKFILIKQSRLNQIYKIVFQSSQSKNYKFLNKSLQGMQQDQSSKETAKKHIQYRMRRLSGRRAYITMELVPYMNMLNPLALCLVTLKNPENMIFTKKVFKYLKSRTLQKTFQRYNFKSETKSKYIIRGYEKLMFPNDSNRQKKHYSSRFNLEYVKNWFDRLQNKQNFMLMVHQILKKQKTKDLKLCARYKRLIDKIMNFQRNSQLNKCQNLFNFSFKKMRIPWTKNVFEEVKNFAQKLLARNTTILNFQEIIQGSSQQ